MKLLLKKKKKLFRLLSKFVKCRRRMKNAKNIKQNYTKDLILYVMHINKIKTKKKAKVLRFSLTKPKSEGMHVVING